MRLARLTALATLALVCSPARVSAQSPAPVGNETELIERLADMAPILDSRRGDIKSVVMIWHVWAQHLGTLRVVCAYATPDQRACTVTHDDVPLFIGVGQDIFVYGPLYGPRLLHGDWSVANADLQGKTGSISISWKIHNIGSSQAGIDLDLRALVMRANHDRAVTPLGKSRYLLKGRMAEGGSVEARVDVSNPARYSHLTARSADDTARFELETLVVDSNIRPNFFRFPSVQAKLHLAPATPVLLDTVGELMQQTVLSFSLRIPLKYPEGRKEWEANVTHPQTGSDWKWRMQPWRRLSGRFCKTWGIRNGHWPWVLARADEIIQWESRGRDASSG
jgi:hypothetical protein